MTNTSYEHPNGIRSPKVKPRHLERRAVVYVRQSSPQQVLDHRESTARQYALTDRAFELGWDRSHIAVIDEDQGRSGQTAEGRPGFQRLLAEVALDQVGLILGLEMSRLARSCSDWHHLLELCARYHTLLVDPDGLYDPTDYNDRLLLGLKGTMSEAELHIIKERMYQGKRNKAGRGDLYTHPPIGYIKLPTGRFALDPDEQVQAVVCLIFDEFDRQGSLHGLLRYLVHHGIRMPVRPHGGPDKGQLQWRRPNRETLQNLLHHPIYAGAYRHGHRPVDPRRQVPGRPSTGRQIRRPEDCEVLILDHEPAYITWSRFQANQAILEANRARSGTPGAPRQGASLLAGLLICGRCGRRMRVSYPGAAGTLHYDCSRGVSDYAEPLCQTIGGGVLDAFVGGRLLAAVEPAALEASIAAIEDMEEERRRLDGIWRQRLERSRYEEDRAARQYHAVEPENRLVARELERRWEQALKDRQQLEQEYERFLKDRPGRLSAEEREELLALSRDLPAVWQAPTTTPADRQRIARLLLERVVVNVVGVSERVEVRLEWAGGHTSDHMVIRPVARYVQRSDYPELVARLRELHELKLSSAAIAERLNGEGFRPPKRTTRFRREMIHRLLTKLGVSRPRPHPEDERTLLGADEWWLSDLSERLSIPRDTLHRWRRVGWVHSRKLNEPRGRWILWADGDEMERLRRLRSCPKTWDNQPLLKELTIPRERVQG
jgi:DNA invertase Pin-like site-specific DNA recombinase